eukprot:4285915-Pleurochrysis_carterae.AAC.2
MMVSVGCIGLLWLHCPSHSAPIGGAAGAPPVQRALLAYVCAPSPPFSAHVLPELCVRVSPSRSARGSP